MWHVISQACISQQQPQNPLQAKSKRQATGIKKRFSRVNWTVWGWTPIALRLANIPKVKAWSRQAASFHGTPYQQGHGDWLESGKGYLELNIEVFGEDILLLSAHGDKLWHYITFECDMMQTAKTTWESFQDKCLAVSPSVACLVSGL